MSGYLGVDPFANVDAPNVRRVDMRDLSWYREEYGLCPKMYSSHSLEHLSYRDVPACVREWYNTLAPGGEILVGVPDAEGYLRTYVEMIDQGKDDTADMAFISNGLFGDHTADGQVHQASFTKRSLRSIFETAGFVDVTVEVDSFEAVEGARPYTAQLILKAKKEE